MPPTDLFRIGSLYPRLANGSPNLILSSGYKLRHDNNGYYVSSVRPNGQGRLTAGLTITTDPVQIPGVSDFVETWLKPQLLAKDDPNSIFGQYWKSIVKTAWPIGAYPNNLLLEALSYLGYRGYGWDKAADNTGLWKEQSSTSGLLYESVQDLQNYQPELIWGNSLAEDRVQSDFDTDSLLVNIAKLQGTFSGEPPLWLPAMLFTYGVKGKGTSYPGPVLMIKPGEELQLDFKNNIRVPGLTNSENQQATYIPNASYGLNGGSTAGGMFSSNFHMHGGHVTPGGFGDNVVGRYTSGQDWTTVIDIPEDHGQGSYWYHPHYHPAVNTQLYGGLSGFMQVGDPLQKIPFFKDTPRNLAVIKTMQVDVDPASGKYQLAAVNGNILGTESLAPNRASMVTVNGEYMPTVNYSSGGWQALTLSNQDNNYYMNISIRHQQPDGSWVDLPIFIYGEDGHQYPQIRAATNGALGYAQQDGENATGYAQAQNLISLPSGKRVDILFYLPSGQSEVVSSYQFNDTGSQKYKINNLRFQANKYVDLSTTNTNPADPLSGPGPIAKLDVNGNMASPALSALQETINQANKQISVQAITPGTTAAEYDDSSVPSVNLYSRDKRGAEEWQPIRKRELNYSVLTLVGPQDQRDIATQKALAQYHAETESEYQTYTMVPGPTWLGYENPDFINDHVFPNGPLIITQIGTMEQWSLKNWNWGGPSVSNGGYLVGHPFHIHLNDYQVKQSDTELPNKRNLEDVTMLNSSGYNYADASGNVHKLDPLVGSFAAIPEAFDPSSELYKNGLFTTGYTDTTIRMLFQDYLGTYVHHCHLLEHEDAGMMQVVTVIENTDSSWLLPAEGFEISKRGLRLREANTLSEVYLRLDSEQRQGIARAQVGDISGDFTQDVILSSAGSNRSGRGRVEIYDGATLKRKRSSKMISSLKPYPKSTLAPWAFNSDFTGDGQRELVTGGYRVNERSRVALSDFEIRGWLPIKDHKSWQNTYRQKPWQNVADLPSGSISSSLTGFAVGDFNLDNFDDYAVAYLSGNQLRIRLLDGAAVSLILQQGIDEGGYLPNQSVLSDMTYTSPSLGHVTSIVLTTGFNSYAQSPIENLIVTTSCPSDHSTALTFQLNAGHFIATAQPSEESSMHSASESHHGGSGLPSRPDVMNSGPLPLQLTETRYWHDDPATATPTFSGVLGNGATLLGDKIVLSQGESLEGFNYGNGSSSDFINNTSQDLFVGLNGIDRVTQDDLTGIVTTNLSSKLSPSKAEERLNLSMLAFQAYTNMMVKPSALAQLAAGPDGQSLSVRKLIDNILTSYSEEIASFYGGPLAKLTVPHIVRKTYQTLYKRKPTSCELQQWRKKVDQGLAKSDLPISILQDTSGRDRVNVAFFSAATRWSQVQWGTSAVIDGAFGQGLQANLSTYDKISRQLFLGPTPATWQSAQRAFDHYRDGVVDILDGTPVSDTGFF